MANPNASYPPRNTSDFMTFYQGFLDLIGLEAVGLHPLMDNALRIALRVGILQGINANQLSSDVTMARLLNDLGVVTESDPKQFDIQIQTLSRYAYMVDDKMPLN